MTGDEKKGLRGQQGREPGQETGRELGLRLGRVCWNQACATPCAELGKLDFLFPKKSSYIRLSGRRQKKEPQAPQPLRRSPGPGARLVRLAPTVLPMALSPFPG